MDAETLKLKLTIDLDGKYAEIDVSELACGDMFVHVRYVAPHVVADIVSVLLDRLGEVVDLYIYEDHLIVRQATYKKGVIVDRREAA